MREHTYYVITDTVNETTTYVNTTKEIEEITGAPRGIFAKMTEGEFYIVGNFGILCEVYKPKMEMYYKNLWREENLKRGV